MLTIHVTNSFPITDPRASNSRIVRHVRAHRGDLVLIPHSRHLPETPMTVPIQDTYSQGIIAGIRIIGLGFRQRVSPNLLNRGPLYTIDPTKSHYTRKEVEDFSLEIQSALHSFLGENRSLFLKCKDEEKMNILFWGDLMRPVYETFRNKLEKHHTAPARAVFNEFGQKITIIETEVPKSAEEKVS